MKYGVLKEKKYLNNPKLREYERKLEELKKEKLNLKQNLKTLIEMINTK